MAFVACHRFPSCSLVWFAFFIGAQEMLTSHRSQSISKFRSHRSDVSTTKIWYSIELYVERYLKGPLRTQETIRVQTTTHFQFFVPLRLHFVG